MPIRPILEAMVEERRSGEQVNVEFATDLETGT